MWKKVSKDSEKVAVINFATNILLLHIYWCWEQLSIDILITNRPLTPGIFKLSDSDLYKYHFYRYPHCQKYDQSKKFMSLAQIKVNQNPPPPHFHLSAFNKAFRTIVYYDSVKYANSKTTPPLSSKLNPFIPVNK